MTYPGWQWDGTQWRPVPAAKKRRTGLVVTLAVLIPGLVILLCAGVALVAFGGGEDTEPPSATVPDRAEGPEETLPTHGRDGQFEFIVQGLERDVLPPNEFWSEEPQGEFVAVTLQVENIGEEPREFDSDAQQLYDVNDREYRSAWGIGEWEYETINPGNVIEVTIYFDVPPGEELARLELRDSMFSGGVEVGLPD